MVQQVNDDLEMKVRRPAAVFVDVADAGELLSARDALAYLERVKGFSREVAVEREKFQTVAGGMAKNHKRAVVERRSVDRDGVDDAIKRRMDRRAGGERIDRFRNEWFAVHPWDFRWPQKVATCRANALRCSVRCQPRAFALFNL